MAATALCDRELHLAAGKRHPHKLLFYDLQARVDGPQLCRVERGGDLGPAPVETPLTLHPAEHFQRVGTEGFRCGSARPINAHAFSLSK